MKIINFSFVITLLLLVSAAPRPMIHGPQPGKGPVLDYINKTPIKMDGGVDYYTSDTGAINPDHYIFIVSEPSKRAFMNVRGEKDYIFLKKKSRSVLSKTSYKDSFAGNGYEATLTVNQAGPVVDYKSRYTGTLVIKHNTDTRTLKVQGRVATY